MRLRKISATVAAGIIGVSMLSACGGSTAGSGIELDFITGQASGSAQLKAFEQVTEAFEEQHPGVTINLLSGTGSLEKDIKVRLAAKNPPDLWNTHGWSRDRYSGFLEPLQNRSWADSVQSMADDAIKEDDGTFYALPIDIQTAGVLYNGDVLKAAGIDPTSLNTWNDFTEACAKVVANGATCVAAAGKEQGSAGNLADYILPGFYDDAQKAQLTAGEFVDDPYERAMTMVAGWTSKGYFNKDYSSATLDDVARLIAQDKAAFFFYGNTQAQLISSYNPDVNLGVMPVPVPKFSSQNPYFSVGEHIAVGVSKTSKHKDVALEYVDFLAQSDNMATLSAVTNNEPGLTGVQADLGILQDSYAYWVDERSAAMVPYFDRIYMPNGMWYNLCKTTDALINGQASAAKTTSQMNALFVSLYRQQSSKGE